MKITGKRSETIEWRTEATGIYIKPGAAQVGAISNTQKLQKDVQVSIFSTRVENRKTKKKWTEWRAKRGTLPKLSTFLSQLKGGPFGEKKFPKTKSRSAEKN